jgi:valyl-tRNA synthetase
MNLKAVDIDKLPKHFENEKQEQLWADFWANHNVYAYDPGRPLDETFVVDTPPPTVSGSLHVGHVFSYSHTDFITRFQRMTGKNIYYPMGWDDNGLPTERRVQNYFNVRCEASAPFIPNFLENFKADKDAAPQNISRQNFIELCNQLTHEDEKIYKKLWQRLGLSIDWHEEYATVDNASRKMAQYSFIDLFEKGHLYQSSSPIMWDVDFQTSIAQAEIEDRPAAGEMFKISFFETGFNKSYTIATTRPELIPACVGIVVNPTDERYAHLKDNHLITPLFGVKVPVITSELVDKEKGTGIVMVCTFGDATDVQWWKENKLSLRQVLGFNGRLQAVEFGSAGWECLAPEKANEFYKRLVGKTVFSAKKEMVEMLRSEQPHWQPFIALQEEPIKLERMVKYYEKGDKPLEFIPSRQWFVRILDKKEILLQRGNEIIWEPAFAKSRFDDWTKNLAFDWNVSRQRYFGVPIPVWYPLNADGVVNYNAPILPGINQLPVDPTIHTPANFTEAQRNQPNGFTAEVDVFDTWFTSALTPQLSSKWVFDKERHKKLFPADIRPQSHEIIRTWAFYTIVKAHLHENTIPWKRVIISGWVLDPDRKKMSKSKGNVETPENWITQYTADGVRYWSAKAKIGVDTTFDINVMKNGARLVTKLFNAGKFVLAHKGEYAAIINELDKAFIDELRKLIAKTTKHFEAFDHASALSETETFFWNNFTDSYLELVKKRASAESNASAAERNSAITTLRMGLETLLKLFAPFLPYITEEIWSWCFAEEKNIKSVHIAPWCRVEDLQHISMPAQPELFTTALRFLDEVKKYKADKNLSYSAAIESVEIKTSLANKNLFENHLAFDILGYSKIVNYSFSENTEEGQPPIILV